jgi:hypothetical protein
MANEIKLKRGSGSDPTASDLVVGELAIRTDNGKIFTKKDNGSVAEISGGGGVSDGDKGDITVSNGGDTFTIDNGVVTSAKIADGTIVNADINSSAAIAGTKISPDFGSQAIVTDGITLETSNNNDTFTGTSSNGIKIRSSSISLQQPSSPNNFYAVFNNNGCDLRVANAQKLVVNSSGTAITGNLDVSSGVDVTGNITVSGTVDGRDVATDGSKLDGIEAGATADQTASEILTLLKTVDGSGSGLDADTLDGVSSGSFARSDAEDTISGKFEFTSSGSYPLKINGSDDQKILLKGSSNPLIKFQESTTDKATIRWNASGYLLLRNDEDGAQVNIRDNLTFSPNSGSNNYKIWHENNDGAGSGLDADTLDGVQASALVAVGGDTMTGNLRVDINSNVDGILGQAYTNYFGLKHADQTLNSEYMIISQDNHTYISASSGSSVFIRNGGNDGTNQLIIGSGNDALTWRGNKVFHAGNDGAGSGLDADTLDGVSSGSFLRSDTGDSASGDIAFQGGAGAVTISANSDIRLENGNWTGNAYGKIQHHSNYLYIAGGTSGIIFREDGTNRWIIDGSGHLAVGADSTYDIGTSGTRVRNGYFDTLYGDGSNLTGISAGATGGGSDEIFYENGQTVTTNYTITNGKNAMSAGPITVNSGVTVTVGAGETLTIV